MSETAPMDRTALIAEAAAHHREGRLPEAEAAYPPACRESASGARPLMRGISLEIAGTSG